MCGICGSTARDSIAAVRVINAAQVHRGPDDEGTYEDPHGRISLGARRLSIIDLAGGHQPLSNEDGTVWAILNGEIYNSPALQARLRARGHRFKSHTDTETLVHLYEDYGDDLVHALKGMFAFAVWDERRGRLLLGRDRFGQKPLFIHTSHRGLMFASELSALIRPLERSPDLDRDALDTYLVLGYVPGPETIAHGVRQLPPGTLMRWDSLDDTVETSSYWAPKRSVLASRESEKELAAETLRLLERAVAETLVSDVPVGIFLSGGVDSTLIAAMVTAMTRDRPQTFTVGYDIGAVSELAEARATAERLGTVHHEVVIGAADVSRRVPDVLGSLDQPLADPAIIPLHAVSELAGRHVTVAIGGEGADELFGGYPRYRWLIRSAQINRVVPRRYAALSARMLASSPFGPRVRRLADVISPQTTLERHLDWVTANRRHARSYLYGPRLRSRAGSNSALLSLASHLEGFSGDLGADAFMQLDQRHWLADDVLFKVDRAGMLNSKEIRAPYLERDVAEFANSVTAVTHLAGSGKKLLRDALAGRFPEVAARRRKTAFRVPGAEWLRGPLRPLLDDQLARGTLVCEGFIDRDALHATISEHATGLDRTSILWPVLSLGLWLDRYAGRSSA
jgi:asparagine synthase (glutamine-hydrolysing)